MSYLIIITLVVKQFCTERILYSLFDIDIIKGDNYITIYCHQVLFLILFRIEIKSQ